MGAGLERMNTKRADTASRFVATLRVVALVAASFLAACTDAGLGVIGSGPTDPLYVEIDGPRSELGAWRYHDGVRLLECDLVMEAWADGSSGSAAQWLDGRIDLHDLRTGQYLGSDYFYAGQLEYLWGEAEIESGERQFTRPLRYRSYGPFRAYVVFRYESRGEEDEASHRFDCR